MFRACFTRFTQGITHVSRMIRTCFEGVKHGECASYTGRASIGLNAHEIRVWKVGQTSDGHYACRRPYYVNYMHFPKHLASVSGTKVDPSSVCASPSKRACKSRQRTWVGSRSVNTRATNRTQQASMHVPSGIRSQPHQGHPRCLYGCRRRAYSNLRSGKLQ